MAILFRKPKKFQNSGSFDRLSDDNARALGVKFTGKNARSLSSTVAAEEAKKLTGQYDTNTDMLHVYDVNGKEVTDRVIRNAPTGDAYAANTANFSQSAGRVKDLFNGTTIRVPFDIEWDPEYVSRTSKGNIGEAYGYTGNIGQMVYKDRRDAPVQRFPLSAENYLKYQEDLAPLFSNRNQSDDLRSSFYKKKTN